MSISAGKLLGSGQRNHMGFRAYVIVWDWQTRTELMRHELHKVCRLPFNPPVAIPPTQKSFKILG
jgi:hypothetical protein